MQMGSLTKPLLVAIQTAAMLNLKLQELWFPRTHCKPAYLIKVSLQFFVILLLQLLLQLRLLQLLTAEVVMVQNQKQYVVAIHALTLEMLTRQKGGSLNTPQTSNNAQNLTFVEIWALKVV